MISPPQVTPQGAKPADQVEQGALTRPGGPAANSRNPLDLLGTLAPRPGLDKDGNVDPFAPLGAAPWSRGINQVAIDSSIPGAGGVPSKLSPEQTAIAALVDPAYQAHQLLTDPQAAAQATHSRWEAVRNGDLSKVGSAYWNDFGTAFTQDLHTALTSGSSPTARGMRALDRTPLGYAVPYAAAATGNIVGGVAHDVVDKTRRWGPAAVATAIPGGAFLAKAVGIDVYRQAMSEHKRDPFGTMIDDGTFVVAIASGGAGAAARAGSAARAGAAAREGAVAGVARETAGPGVARSQAGLSPWSSTKDFAQPGWDRIKGLFTPDTPNSAAARRGPGTPHRDDVGKPDRYLPPDNVAGPGSGPKNPAADAKLSPHQEIPAELAQKLAGTDGVPLASVEGKNLPGSDYRTRVDGDRYERDPEWTVAGRALSKKLNRTEEGPNYSQLRPPKGQGGPAGMNAMAKKFIDDVLNNHRTKVRIEPGRDKSGSWTNDLVSFRLPDGRGIRFQHNGIFLGFV